ncbi:hypothetical protein GZ78_28285 [Endozoicomonas numazuensis]|uniref:Uncharacterized protein n=1 Tax=Endozoicomonas numazuensis TaxID=1137799 RepID=A0A081N111_9GAMM|nr:hypothetical protein GZ78_28285 [Endozoicomonas numazuensis]
MKPENSQVSKGFFIKVLNCAVSHQSKKQSQIAGRDSEGCSSVSVSFEDCKAGSLPDLCMSLAGSWTDHGSWGA